ncbi:MAG: twin-arginine translocase subunit TatC [Candidatus Competibacteraceae bacterium]
MCAVAVSDPLKFTLVLAVFITIPWILYQVWAFIAPGLYPRRNDWPCQF